MEKARTNRLTDVVFIRCFSILVVVAFHAYGMMLAKGHFPNLYLKYESLYERYVSMGVINYAMPLFIFISGYLFSYLLGLHKYKVFTTFVWNKFKRLIIPFWLFCIMMMLTNNCFNIWNLLNGTFLHLWYLPMLFWCFIITYFLHKVDYQPLIKSLILVCTFFLMSTPKISPIIGGFYNIPKWFFWFYLGYCIFPLKEYVINIFLKYKLYYLLFIIYLIIQCSYEIEYGLNTPILDLARFCMVMLLWFLGNIISTYISDISKYKVILEIDRCSYGIYIFHNWIQIYLISRTAQRLFPLERWAAEHTILFPLCFFLLSLGISYVLTRLLLKTKVGRFLIG